jgi:hypothetical protein
MLFILRLQVTLWHLFNLLSPRHWLDIAATTLKEQLGRNWNISLVQTAGLDKGRARHTLGLGVEVTAAVWKYMSLAHVKIKLPAMNGAYVILTTTEEMGVWFS